MPLVLRFYFPFRGCYGGQLKREFPIVQQTPDLWSSMKIFALCLKLLKREKEMLFSMDLWKQKHWFVLLGVCHFLNDSLMFLGALRGPHFFQASLAPGETVWSFSWVFSSTLCISCILCSLWIPTCNDPSVLCHPVFPREENYLALINRNYKEWMGYSSFCISVFKKMLKVGRLGGWAG